MIGFPSHDTDPVVLTEDHIISVLLVRRARDDALGQNLFSDPAWDILLELFGAKLGGRSITASDLARSIQTPLSTTLRWISALQQRGLIECEIIEGDARSVELSSEGVSRMERLGSRWATAFLAIA